MEPLRTYNGKPIAAASPALEAALDKLGVAHDGDVVEIPPAHAAAAGNVGNTGAHGELGSNAKS